MEIDSEVTRFVVLGDPHGALDAVLEVIEQESGPGCLPVCVGDVVGYADGPSSSNLADFISNRKIPTVLGNHEDWVGSSGDLSIVSDSTASRSLTNSALRWIESLPLHIKFRYKADRGPVAVMIHSIRNPRWDWIDESNANRLVEQLGGPSLVFTGHSHRPRMLVSHGGGTVRIIPFDFSVSDSSRHALPDDGCCIVDAGSLARAELDPSLGFSKTHSERGRTGTYAVVDLQDRSVTFRALDLSRLSSTD